MDELIAQFEKNATEVVRVSLTEYRKRKLVDVRVYYSDDEGEYRPTKKGVSLSLEVYPDFKRALAALEKRSSSVTCSAPRISQIYRLSRWRRVIDHGPLSSRVSVVSRATG